MKADEARLLDFLRASKQFVCVKLYVLALIEQALEWQMEDAQTP